EVEMVNPARAHSAANLGGRGGEDESVTPLNDLPGHLATVALDAMEDMVCLVDVRHGDAAAPWTFVWVNSAAQGLTGYTREELLAGGPELLAGADGGTAELGAVLEGGAAASVTRTVRRRDGSELAGAISFVPLGPGMPGYDR